MLFEEEIKKVVESPQEDYPKNDSDYQTFSESNYDSKATQRVEKEVD